MYGEQLLTSSTNQNFSKMWALVDCNNFFCSVEKTFHPGLRHKPVCVLSNNDGCIVALTPECKKIGLHRGDPIFKVMDIVNRYQVKVFSGNMYLYAAMSKRITSILRKSVQHVEKYSIDECFCDLEGYEKNYDLEDYMRSVAQKIVTWTDVPVSVGIAPSKTLAKIGSKFAKNYKGYRSICSIDNEEKRRKALNIFPLEDVWGIGRSTLSALEYHSIHTPLEFADKKESWVRNHFNLPGLRTWQELNGIPCIDTREIAKKQSLCTSRSFGDMVTDIDSLKEAVAHFAASSANKLRGQYSVAGSVTVFIYSNRFRDDLSQYNNAMTLSFSSPTSDTLEITALALNILHLIYKPGIMYKKAGVILSDITEARPFQLNLFDPISNRKERHQLMKSIDVINQTFGLKIIQLAVEGIGSHKWDIKCEHRSPNYLTDINHLLTIF